MMIVAVTSDLLDSKDKKISLKNVTRGFKVDPRKTLNVHQIQILLIPITSLWPVIRLKKQQLETKFQLELKYKSKTVPISTLTQSKLRSRFLQRESLEFLSTRTLGRRDTSNCLNVTLATVKCFSGNGIIFSIIWGCTRENAHFCVLNPFVLSLLLKKQILTSI